MRALEAPPASRPQLLMLWACHARDDAGDKQNPPVVLLGTQAFRFRYTTLARANGATLAKLRAAFVSADAARATCRTFGLRYIAQDDTAALAAAPRRAGAIIDSVLCPAFAGDRAQGVIVDYEVADDRAPSETLVFLRKLAGVAPWVPKFLYTNEVGSAGFRRSGLAGIGPLLGPLFSGISIFQANSARRLRAQAATFERRAKLFVTIDLATNDAPSIGYVFNTIVQDRLAGVHFWRNGADPEAPATRLKVDLFAPWAATLTPAPSP